MPSALTSLIATLRIGREDPVRLAYGLWPGLELEEWQEAALREIWTNPRVSIVSCNGAGKTLVLAIAVILFMLCYPPAIVVTTAGSWTQVRRQLWKEIHRWYALLPDDYQLPVLNTTDWEITPEWFALGVSTNNAGLFEGYHGPHILVVVDEGKSVGTTIFDAINRIFAGTGNVHCVQASSPGSNAGPHYDSHHGKAERWTRIKVNPFEAIVRKGGKSTMYPGSKRLSPEYIQEMRDEYGEDSPLFQSIVMANWTEQSAFKLFPLPSLDLLRQSLHESREMLDRFMGVDVARGGDDECAIVVTEDYLDKDDEQSPVYTGVIDQDAFHTDDTQVLWSKVREMAMKWNVPRENIQIDDGSMGGGMIDAARKHGWSVKGVSFGASPILTQPSLADMVSELWWKGSRKAKAGLLRGVEDPRLLSQLNHRKYDFNDKDKLKVESKKLMRKRLIKLYPNLAWHSPDRADAFLLAIYRGLRSEGLPGDTFVKANQPSKRDGERAISGGARGGDGFRVRGA